MILQEAVSSANRSRVFLPPRRQSRNFFLQHPVIPRRWRNSIAKEHLTQHDAFDGDSPTLHMQARKIFTCGFIVPIVTFGVTVQYSVCILVI